MNPFAIKFQYSILYYNRLSIRGQSSFSEITISSPSSLILISVSSYQESSFIICSGTIIKYFPVIGSTCMESKISPEFFFMSLYYMRPFMNYIVLKNFLSEIGIYRSIWVVYSLYGPLRIKTTPPPPAPSRTTRLPQHERLRGGIAAPPLKVTPGRTGSLLPDCTSTDAPDPATPHKRYEVLPNQRRTNHPPKCRRCESCAAAARPYGQPR